MGKAWQNVSALLGLWAVSQALFSSPIEAQLSPTFYSTSCPQIIPIVGREVKAAVDAEARMAASLLRLHFHDCFVQGCDASVLLDTLPSEKNAVSNAGSLRGFEVIDNIKAVVEAACPNVVSCADIVTLASFFSVVLTGGPRWPVPLGRRDSLATNFSLTSNLPAAFADITRLKESFAVQNLDTTDLVALSGGHTLGLARCVSFKPDLYNFTGKGDTDQSINQSLAAILKQRCPNVVASNNLTNKLDIRTDTVFDNLFFQNLLVGNGVINSDRVLFTSASDTKALVELYAKDQNKFFADFAASMIKMGNIEVLTGNSGEIRKNCRVPNGVTIIDEEQEQSPTQTDVKSSKGAVEFLKQVMKDVVKELFGDEMESLVEKSVSEEHSSM